MPVKHKTGFFFCGLSLTVAPEKGLSGTFSEAQMVVLCWLFITWIPSLPALPFWLSVGSDSPAYPSSPPLLIPPAEVLLLLLLLFVHQPANLLLLQGAASCSDSRLSAGMVLKACENLSCTETGSQSESSPSGTPKTNTLTRWRGVCARQKCTLAPGPKQAPILVTWDRETDGLFRSEADDYFA